MSGFEDDFGEMVEGGKEEQPQEDLLQVYILYRVYSQIGFRGDVHPPKNRREKILLSRLLLLNVSKAHTVRMLS